MPFSGPDTSRWPMLLRPNPKHPSFDITRKELNQDFWHRHGPDQVPFQQPRVVWLERWLEQPVLNKDIQRSLENRLRLSNGPSGEPCNVLLQYYTALYGTIGQYR